MIVHDVQQGTEEWHQIRLARPTASRFKDILTQPRKKEDQISRTAFAYLCECFAEWALGEPLDGASSPWMDRGQRQEAEALVYYQAALAPDDAKAEPVGVVTLDNDLLSPGCSPDALVGDDGGVEIKIHGAKQHVAFMFEPDRFLKEHWAQVQGGLWISGRAWWHLVAYNPALAPVVHRVEPDDEYIQNLAERVEEFTAMLHERLVEFGYQPQSVATAFRPAGTSAGTERPVDDAPASPMASEGPREATLAEPAAT